MDVTGALRGRGALVTGAAGGIGLAIAQALARQGCAVALHGTEAPAAAAAALEGLRSAGVRATYHAADFRRRAEVEGTVEAARAALGAIDIVVNNAVTRHFAPLESFPVQAWDDALAVNLSAAFHTARLTLPAMRARGWGRVINMTSVYAERGVPGRIDYITTKAALAGMTRAIAAEVTGQGVTCNAVCPGSVLTPSIDGRLQQLMRDQALDRETATREFLRGKQPGGRFVPAAHVADLVLFLCGDSAAEINGATYAMDQGWMAT